MHLRRFFRRSRVAALLALAGLLALPAVALAQDQAITITLEKHAQLIAGGGVRIQVLIACDPLPGTEEFQEGLAGASQAKTGAQSEGGLDGPVVCDGLAHTYTAHLFPYTDEGFKPGPASANVGLTICHVVDNGQLCAHGGAGGRIIIRGPRVR
jgi:hypothetical protein